MNLPVLLLSLILVFTSTTATMRTKVTRFPPITRTTLPVCDYFRNNHRLCMCNTYKRIGPYCAQMEEAAVLFNCGKF
ncbi:hypothetical protein PRIPAC_74654 [Pristionchus pacificus]|uniref:Uncharacterized protein n=1 Tax=Pristionchus pacificus TaxID=54126 RepID=A0A454XRI5_PRIPA|nr:hypothetical protein PRIPAC_74654 [Pristionchus pacificus]|eukprot:PDM64953.1 hypothetical protein PRIPAC_53209 [Pristionchus pacificus]